MDCDARRPGRFVLEEATIDDLHAAIRAGRTTVVAVVQRYLARVRAYNGVASALVTQDGAPVAASERRGAGRRSAQVPDRDRHGLDDPARSRQVPGPAARIRPHGGDRLEAGRAAAVRHDRRHANAGQLNAIGTLNIRGERSVTCRGEFDKHPSQGPLPPDAPPVCEMFRRQPDALERAAELDKRVTGRTPISTRCRCTASCSRSRTRSTPRTCARPAAATPRYDIDFPARDHVLVEQLRNKGAIIFAKAVNTEYNGRAGDPGGRHKPDKVLPSVLGYQRSTWAGNPANPYDTTRSASLGSSSGSGVSVSANLVMASLGEETRASCRGPSNHNAVRADPAAQGDARLRRRRDRRRHLLRPDAASIAPHDRRLREDARRAEGPGATATTTRAIRYTTVPRSSVLARPTPATPRRRGAPGALEGMRSASSASRWCIRRARRPRSRSSTAADQRDQGGPRRTARRDARRVRPTRCGRPIPDVEQMTVDFRKALARLVPVFMPDLLFRVKAGRHAGVSRISPRRSCRPSSRRAKSSASGTMQPIDYCVELAEGRIAPPRESRHRHHPEAGAGDGVPLPHPAVPDAPRRRLAGEGLHARR